MHPRIQELIGYLRRERENLRAAVDSVPRDRHGVSPGAGGWTVLQVLDHLAIVDARITALIRNKVGEARIAGLGAETDASPLLPTLDLTPVKDRSVKIPAPNSIRPGTSVADVDTAWQALGATRESLHEALRECDGLALGEVHHPHLVFGPLNMYHWIAFIGAHEARHADQIREIGASLAGSSA